MFGGFKMGAGFDDDVTSTFVTHITYEDGTRTSQPNITGGSNLKKWQSSKTYILSFQRPYVNDIREFVNRKKNLSLLYVMQFFH